MTMHGQSAIPFDTSEYACIDLVNSKFSDYRGTGSPTDRLESPEWRHWFVSRHGLTPDDVDAAPLDQLAAVRHDVRRILEKWASGRPVNRRDKALLDQRLGGAAFRLRLAAAGDAFELSREPLERSWEWVLAAIVASTVELLRDGDPARLKSCDNADCSWMFYDNSMNRSRRFCSTSPCGTLIRVRRFRQGL